MSVVIVTVHSLPKHATQMPIEVGLKWRSHHVTDCAKPGPTHVRNMQKGALHAVATIAHVQTGNLAEPRVVDRVHTPLQ